MSDLYRVMYSYLKQGDSVASNYGVLFREAFFVAGTPQEAREKAVAAGFLTENIPDGSIKIWKAAIPFSMPKLYADNERFSLEPKVSADKVGRPTLEFIVKEK